MEQRYLVIKSERIYCESYRGYVSVFSFLVDETGNEHYPLHYPAKYMIPCESEAVGFSDSDIQKINDNVNFIRFLTVGILDENGNLLILDKQVPHDVFWGCTLKFAKENNWIDK